jgi:hypothetical protein
MIGSIDFLNTFFEVRPMKKSEAIHKATEALFLVYKDEATDFIHKESEQDLWERIEGWILHAKDQIEEEITEWEDNKEDEE